MAERLQTLFILHREEAKNAKKNLKILKNISKARMGLCSICS